MIIAFNNYLGCVLLFENRSSRLARYMSSTLCFYFNTYVTFKYKFQIPEAFLDIFPSLSKIPRSATKIICPRYLNELTFFYLLSIQLQFKNILCI